MAKNKSKKKAKFYEFGYTLVEVLIANFILAFGLLSITLLSTTLLQRMQDAHWRSVAVLALHNVAQQFSANDFNCASWLDECAKVLPGVQGQCLVGRNSYEFSLCFRTFHARNECMRLVISRSMLPLSSHDLGAESSLTKLSSNN